MRSDSSSYSLRYCLRASIIGYKMIFVIFFLCFSGIANGLSEFVISYRPIDGRRTLLFQKRVSEGEREVFMRDRKLALASAMASVEEIYSTSDIDVENTADDYLSTETKEKPEDLSPSTNSFHKNTQDKPIEKKDPEKDGKSDKKASSGELQSPHIRRRRLNLNPIPSSMFFLATLSDSEVQLLRERHANIELTPNVMVKAAIESEPVSKSANDFLRREIIARPLEELMESAGDPIKKTQVSPYTKRTPSWGIDRIDQRSNNIDGSFSWGGNASNVDIFLLDSGVRTSHNEFRGVNINNVEFVDAEGTNDGRDCNGHGTHIAGTLVGRTVGIASGATLHNVRVYGCDAEGPLSQILAGIEWVIGTIDSIEKSNSRVGSPETFLDSGSLLSIEGNARVPISTLKRRAVVSLSFAATRMAVLDQAVGELAELGALVIVAAGNAGADACQYSPAHAATLYRGILTVSAVGPSDRLAAFSNRGQCVGLSAPGEQILSAAVENDEWFALMSGTSMAAPHVAAAAALIWGQLDREKSLGAQELQDLRSGKLDGLDPTVNTDADEVISVLHCSSLKNVVEIDDEAAAAEFFSPPSRIIDANNVRGNGVKAIATGRIQTNSMMSNGMGEKDLLHIFPGGFKGICSEDVGRDVQPSPSSIPTRRYDGFLDWLRDEANGFDSGSSAGTIDSRVVSIVTGSILFAAM